MYCLDLYPGFVCLAGDCPATCCAGWHIVIDADSWQRFQKLDDVLKKDILANSSQRDGRYSFRNMPDGRCAMLDEDGLCRIWRHAGEQALCITCRKYPALIGEVQGQTWVSMAASCPIVAEYLWQGQIGWIFHGEKGSQKIALQEIKEQKAVFFDPFHQWMIKKRKDFQQNVLQDGAKTCYDLMNYEISTVLQASGKVRMQYQDMLDFVSGCVELLILSPELPYLPGCFDYFESEGWEDGSEELAIGSFENACLKELGRFYENYLPYRWYSRILEYPEELEVDRTYRILGEAVFFYVIHLSRYHTLSEHTKEQAISEITWMYRLLVHSPSREERFLRLLKEIFPDVRKLAGALAGRD